MPVSSRPAAGRADDPYRIATLEALRRVIPEPSPRLESKVFEDIDRHAARFIAHAPIVFVATCDREGYLDVSPKGDAPGFVEVEDPRTLLIPERPGNHLAYGFRNLLENPEVGLIFVVPGAIETLRVNGAAEITRDPQLLERLAARGKPAVLATRVRVRESFFHCGRAFLRSSLWRPDTWPTGVRLSVGRQLADRHGAGEEAARAIDRGIEKSYEKGLY